MRNRFIGMAAVAVVALQAGMAGAQQYDAPPQGGPRLLIPQASGQQPRPPQPPQGHQQQQAQQQGQQQGRPPATPDRDGEHHRRDNTGKDAAIIGLGIVSGFAVGNVLDNHGTIPTVRYPGPPPEPVEPREPRPPRYGGYPPPPPPGGWDRRGDDRWGPPPPWSPGWYRWCSDNYPSFDPRDGSVRGRDGFRRMCVVR